MSNRYRVNGTGNWSDSANHWSDTDGGTPGIQFIPTHNDDVFFNNNSSGASYTVTMNATGQCNGMTWANPATGSPTFAGSAELHIFGNLTLVSGMTWSATSTLLFMATATGKTITSNGVAITSPVQFRGIGGGWTLQDAFSTTGLTAIYAGAFDTNNQSFTTAGFIILLAFYIDSTCNDVARSVSFGSSAITCNGNWTMNKSNNLTFNAGTSTITCNTATFSGGDDTYYNVVLNGAGNVNISGVNTFNNLTRTGTAVVTDTFYLSGNQTINGTLTINGNSDLNRVLVRSNILGTQRTLTAANVTCTNVDFQDIIGAGAGSWNLSSISGGAGDCGNNSGITFSTARTLYYHQATAGADLFSTSAKWWTATNGTGSQATYPPLPQDTLNFDANSFDTTSLGVTQNMARFPGCDWTGVTNTPSLTMTQAASVFGDIKLVSGMTITGNGLYTLAKRGAMNITSGTQTWGKSFTVNCISGVGSVILQDYLNQGAFTTMLSSGTLDTNGKTFTLGTFSGGGGTLTLGASTMNISNGFAKNGTTITAGTSTIKISGGNFSGGDTTYYNVEFNGSSNTVSGANTYNNLTLSTSATIITLSADQTINGTFTCNGTSATSRNIIGSDVKGTRRTITAATVTVTNTDFQDITGAGAGSWNLSAQSVGDCGNNSGITFPTGITCYMKTGVSADFNSAIWYTTSGGSTSARVPLPQDIARIDSASITAGSVVLTQNIARIGTINFTGATNTPELTISSVFSCFGSITLISGMTLTSGSQTVTLEGRGSYTITSAGQTIQIGSLAINCGGGNYSLSDALTLPAGSGILLQSGTFSMNNFNATVGSFSSALTTTRTFTMGSGTLELNGSGTVWDTSTFTGLTVNGDTSTVKLTNNSTSGKTVTFGTLSGITLYNFWNATTGTGTLTITGGATFNDFKVNAGRTVSFSADSIYTVSSFTCTGSAGSLITLGSNSSGRRARLKKTTGTVNCDYISISNISVTGGATWNAGANSTVGNNCVGRNGVTLPARYWVPGGNGFIADTSNWSETDGGASGASVPVGNDVYFTANSGSGDVSFITPINVGAVNMTGFTGALIGSVGNRGVYGNFNVGSLVTNYCRSNFTFFPTFNNITITSNGVQFQSTVTLATVVDTVTLGDDFYSIVGFTLQSGTFDTNNKNMFLSGFTFTGSLAKTLTLGSSIITTAGSSSAWTASTAGTTLNAGTSTIKLTNPSTLIACSFSGAGLTYNNVEYIPFGAANLTMSGSNIFNDFKVSVRPRTVSFAGGTTTTVTTFSVNGTAGNLITIGSSTSATHTLAKAGGGTISCNYLSISNSTATPATTWYAVNSTDGGGNTGWIFTEPPVGGQNSNMFLFF